MSINQKKLLIFIFCSFPLYFTMIFFVNFISWQAAVIFYLIIPIIYKSIFLKDNTLEAIPFVMVATGIIEVIARYLNIANT